MSLEDWSDSGLLRKEQTSPNEIRDILNTIKREIHHMEKATEVGFSLDTVFRFAYNAARQCAKLALRASGYRVPGSIGSHYWILQSLRLTLALDAMTIEKLDHYREKRNMVEYVQADVVSQIEVNEMIDLAKSLFGEVTAWLKENHPELLQDG